MTEHQNELTPSELGKLDFWEDTYALELENFKDHGDVGKVWFGETTASKVVRYISEKLNLSKEEDKIVDLGCGNGMMLVNLANEGFKKLVGLDYSRKAIDLSTQILGEQNVKGVELLVCDITADVRSDILNNVKVLHDKGTYDAISLNPEGAKDRRQKYIENVSTWLLSGGYFVITSCNWTKDELVDHFRDKFDLHCEIPNKTFSFGGKTGTRVAQLVFVKSCEKQ